MKIVVLVKQVPDMNSVKIDRNTGTPILGSQRVVSSYDEHAIEEALLLKERHAAEVTVICVGPPSAKDAVTRALAMGADRGILIENDDPNSIDTLAIARLLAEHVRATNPELVLAGQTADDYEAGQVGAQVAECLALPLVSSVVALSVEDDGASLVAKRDMEDGYQTVRTPLPAVVLASTGLNIPRLPSLKGIMAAKKKPLDRVSGAPEPSTDRIAWGELTVPERGAAGVLLQGVPAPEAARQLVAWLGERKLL